MIPVLPSAVLETLIIAAQEFYSIELDLGRELLQLLVQLSERLHQIVENGLKLGVLDLQAPQALFRSRFEAL